MINWIKNKFQNKHFKPQPCPFCNVEFGKAWIEQGKQGNDIFYVEHKNPSCYFHDEKTQIFLWTEKEIKTFREWCKQRN